MERRKTRKIKIGDTFIGGDSPVTIQSMTKTDTRDVRSTVEQINLLEKAGCQIVRVAVKDTPAANSIKDIKKGIKIPLVADIHFDHTLALAAIENGADKIRINPGNIMDGKDIDTIIAAAKAKNVPIRIGVNSGSLVRIAAKKGKKADVMVDALLRYLEAFEKRKFRDIVLSLKSSDVETTIQAYEKMAEQCDYPFHVGVTAAGSHDNGIVKSSIGIGALLARGIGDTVRVSLTGDPVMEVLAAKRIFSALGLRRFGPEIIACPTCGRCQVDLVKIVDEVEGKISSDHSFPQKNKRLIVAIMGCEVKGRGKPPKPI